MITVAPKPPKTIRLPPLHEKQSEVQAHPARFKILACGRRWGKTRLGSALCVATAIRGGRAWWVAPSYKVAAVGWRQIRTLGQQLPDAVLREGDRLLTLAGGGTVQVRSADDPDSLRGEGLDFLVMDECAFIPEPAWGEALRPALSDRLGKALFISTPAGMNWFWRLWLHGQEEDESTWRSWQFPTITNPFIAPAEVEDARRQLPERVFQQEYLAIFQEDGGGVFLKVRDAIDPGRKENEPPHPNQRYAVGVDLARVEDFTVITVLDRDRRQVYHERFNQISWERQVAAIARVSQAYHRAPVALDTTGLGDPIHEAVRKAHVQVIPYHFTNTTKEALIDALAINLEAGELRLMDVPAQTAELLAYQYELTPARNVRMSAPEGMHDDTVIALGLANYAVGVSGDSRRGAVAGKRPVVASYVVR